MIETPARPTAVPFLRRLLVATDGLEDGTRALKYALALANRYASELVIFYAFERIPALGETNRAGALVDAEAILGTALRQAHDAGIAATTNFAHIKRHYYATHDDINPTRIVPIGPEQHLETPHGREHL